MAVSMIEALDAVRELLASQDLRYKFDDEDKVFSVTFALKKTKLRSLTVLIRVVESKKNPDECIRIESHASVGISADEDCMAEMAEFLHRANFGLIFGCFELDCNDGEIRYRLAYNCIDALPGYDALDDLLYIPITMVDRYGDGILAMSMGVTSPAEAIRQIEGD